MGPEILLKGKKEAPYKADCTLSYSSQSKGNRQAEFTYDRLIIIVISSYNCCTSRTPRPNVSMKISQVLGFLMTRSRWKQRLQEPTPAYLTIIQA